MKVVLSILLLYCFTYCISSGDTSDSCELVLNVNKYSEESNRWQEYLDNIEMAEQDFTPCGHTDSGCSKCHDSVIDQDLEVFKDGISKEMIDEAMGIPRVVKYQIINNKLYRSEDCMFPFRCTGIEHFLLDLIGELPDMEFVVNTRDWPQVNNYVSGSLPVFSFSKTKDFKDIMYPAWTFWEGGPAIGIYPTGLGRWDKHISSLSKAAQLHPWTQKKDKAFFRGSRTSDERDPLILLSRKCPDLADAQYTKNQAWKSDKDTLGYPPASEVKLEDHCGYRYLVNYRGVAASFRFKHLFLCNSTVFHVGDEWLEFFYPALVPWFHYVPVDSKATQSELANLLEFAKHHQEKMRQIGEQGAAFIRDHLKFGDVTCYWRQLLHKYSQLLQYQPHLDQSLIPIHR